MFRNNLREGTDLGKEVRFYVDKGDLVPDNLVTSMVIQELEGYKGQKGHEEGRERHEGRERCEKRKGLGEHEGREKRKGHERREGQKNQHFILDGFPRTLGQAEALEEICSKEGIGIIKGVFYLNVPSVDIVKRLSGRRVCESCGTIYHMNSKSESKTGVCDICQGHVVQRKDDTQEAIENRLNVYKKSTEPLMAYYKDKGLIYEVDGVGDTQDVFKRLEGILD